MKCALCSNTDNLLIQVQAGSGLTLHLCPTHEDTPLFEVAARLAVENEKLREQVFTRKELRMLLKGLSCATYKYYLPNGHECIEERDLLYRLKVMLGDES